MSRASLIHDLDLVIPVVVAAVLGFGIGWEREVRGHPAGSRTFALICSGAALYTVVAVDACPATAEKLISGVVTGVGFIGAGIVLRDPSGHVRGLTTAAATWAVAAVGVSAGAGRFTLAIAASLLWITILEFRVLPLVGRLDARRWASRFADDNATSDPPVQPPV